MAFKVGTTSVFPGVYTAPDSPANGGGLFSDGSNSYWAYPGVTASLVGTGFRYRTTFTHGFLAGGYKGSNPWRSVNKTWHASDITIYCGEQLDRPAAYAMGSFSDYNGYIFSGAAGFQGASTHTSSINLHTGNSRTRSRDQYGAGAAPFGYEGRDPQNEGIPYGTTTPAGTPDVDNSERIMAGVGGWEMSTPFMNGWGIPNQIGQTSYIGGGGLAAASGFQKLHHGTEVMYNTSASGATGTAAAVPGETKGYYSFAGTRKYITYSNDTWTAFTSTCGPDGVCKPLPTKLGFHYWGSGANATLPQIKLVESTSTDSTMANKLIANGEDNNQMGQDWGYMLGGYNGQQNNYTVKYTYATDTQTAMGYATRPKGHTGQSSGQCFSAAALVTSANIN